MKKVLKLLTYILSITLGLVIILMVVAKLAENRISEIALQKVSRNIEAPVAIEEVSFNMLRKFPLASIELNDVSFCGQTDTSCVQQPDTLLQLNKVYVAVKSKPLLNGIIEVMKVDIEGGKVQYTIDSSGVSSIYFLTKTTDTLPNDTSPGKPLNITLKELTLKNLTCYYHDSLNQVAARVKIPEMVVDGRLSGKNMQGSAKGKLRISRCSLAKTPLHLMESANLAFNAGYTDDSLAIENLRVDTEGAVIDVVGGIQLGKSIKTDLTLKKSELVVEKLTKYVPAKILYKLGLKELKGEMQVNGTINGVYSESQMPRFNLNVSYSKGNIHTNEYPEINNLRFSGKVTNGFLRNNQTTRIQFNKFAFESGQSTVDLSFSLLDLDQPKYDINTRMKLHLEEFRDFIPDSLIEDAEGVVNLDLATRGIMPDTIRKDFTDSLLAWTQADVELSDVSISKDTGLRVENLSAAISYQPGKLTIENLNGSLPVQGLQINNSSLSSRFEGSVNKLDEMAIFLDRYDLNTNHSNIKGNLEVRNLQKPEYKTDSRISLNLNEVKAMLSDTLLTSMNGTIDAHIQSKGKVNPDSLSSQLNDLIFRKGSYAVDFKNVYAALPEYPDYTIEGLTGKVTLDSASVTVNDFSGVAAGMQFGIDSTIIKNLYETVILKQAKPLEVDTRVNLGDLYYNRIMALIPADTSKSPESDEVGDMEGNESGSYTLAIKGAASVKSFTYDSVYMENISTLFSIQDSIYTVDQFQFDAFGGHLNTSANYIIKPDNRAIIQMKNNITRMDIKKLLEDFNDFEKFYEPSIRSENLSGLLTCDFYTRADVLGDSLDQDALRVKGDFQLEEGGVYNFEPATALSEKTNINELDNIQFKNLNSQVFIMKGAIYVPQTYISSTALDITAYGMQEFGTDYEYHLKLHLSDILVGKSDKLLKEQAKRGDIAEKDERNNAVYMMAYSEDGKAKTGFDKKKFQSAMKTKIRLQEALLKVRFHPEMFKFETGVYSE